MAPRSCKLCSLLSGDTDMKFSAKFMTLDDQKTHSQFHLFQLGYISDDGDQVPLKKVFADCFPLEEFEKPKESSAEVKESENSRLTLLEICKNIIDEKKNDSNTIECQFCDSSVKYTMDGGYIVPHKILNHAVSHSDKKPFICRECQHMTTSKVTITKHIGRNHNIASPVVGEHLDECWIGCFDEIKESLVKCFGPLPLVLGSTSSKTRTRPSELAIQRRSVLFKMYKSANKAKKLRCGQCGKETFAKCVQHLEAHVHYHLRQRMFDCSKCEYTSKYRSNITRHLVKEHDGARMEGNHVDHSDEHHDEILDSAKKCFGDKLA